MELKEDVEIASVVEKLTEADQGSVNTLKFIFNASS